jgi:peroxiredoxin
MNPNLKEGSRFPDLTLPDHAGATRPLSEIAEDAPTVINFYRGWWCPKEQRFMRNLVELQDELEVAYTQIVSISVDEPETAAAFRAGLGARWTFLSDSQRSVIGELDLEEPTDPWHKPFLPYTFVVHSNLTIHSLYNGYWFHGRPTNEELRQDLRTVTKAVRKNWDAQSD